MRILNALPVSFWARVESKARVAQGKGWGAETVVQEVQAAVSLLPDISRHSPIVADVGANTGKWTRALLTTAPKACVYAFEPSSAAFSRLRDNLEKESRVHLFNVAVGSQAGTDTLWADSPGSGLASLSRRRLDHFDIDFNHSESVQVLTLDSWCSKIQVLPSLIKIDVEGHEMEVLRGAEEVLKSSSVVQFEFGGCNIDSRTYFQDFYYFFQDFGFRLFRLSARGLIPVTRYSELDESFSTTNYFAQKIEGEAKSTRNLDA